MKVVILIFAVTDCKTRLPCGRARRPAPTTENIKFSVQPQLCEKPACTASALCFQKTDFRKRPAARAVPTDCALFGFTQNFPIPHL